MQIVLLERVEKLGQMGDVVSVKDGYARNFLLPQKKALRSTKANIAAFEAERVQLEARNLERRSEAEGVAEKMNGMSVIILRSASETGNLYGSVTARDIADAVDHNADDVDAPLGVSIDRRQIVLDRPVKSLGLHDVRVTLHPEVSATISVNVARSLDEAEIQASGKSIAELRAEEEAADDMDVAALFEDMGKFDEDAEERGDDDDGEAQEAPAERGGEQPA